MPGDRLIQLYAAINDSRRSRNEAEARGDTLGKAQADATIRYLRGAAESILTPRARASLYN